MRTNTTELTSSQRNLTVKGLELKIAKMLFVMLLGLTLTACGGGGGGGGSSSGSGGSTVVTSTLSFPLLSGFRTLIASGYTKSGVVTGTCSGSATMTIAPASTAATFEGQSVLSSSETWSRTYTNCTPASNTSSGTIYYNSSDYTPMGGVNISSMNSIGGWSNYGVFQTPPVIPASVRVGDSGYIGTITLWTNSAKTTPDGRISVYYEITADTASSAIVYVNSTRYPEASFTSSFFIVERYRMSSTGALTPLTKYGSDSTTGQYETVTMN